MEKSKMQVRRTSEIASAGMALVKQGKIRNHKLGNSSRIHTGEVEKESTRFTETFFPAKIAAWCMN